MPFSLDDEPVFRKVSEHGLGHLVSPYGPGDRTRRWIQEDWRCIIDAELPQPWWYALPAVSPTAVTSPLILHAFDGYNRQRPPELQIRPFNFVLSAHVAEFGHPEGVDPTRFHLIAPYSTEPEEYLALPWFDRFTGTEYAISVDEALMDPAVAVVRSYGRGLRELPPSSGGKEPRYRTPRWHR